MRVVGKDELPERTGERRRTAAAKRLLVPRRERGQLRDDRTQHLFRAGQKGERGAFFPGCIALDGHARERLRRKGARLHVEQVFRSRKPFADLPHVLRKGRRLVPERGIDPGAFRKPGRHHVRARLQVGHDGIAGGIEEIGTPHVRKPRFVIGKAARLFVQFEHQPPQGCVLAPAEVDGEQRGKLLAVTGVCVFKRRIHGAGGEFHALRLLRPRDAEGGIDADQIKIGAHEPAAEGVDGADLRQRKGRELLFEALALLPLACGDPLQQGKPQALLHLRGRLVGEGDGKDAAHVLAAEDEPDKALDHDERLTAPGGGGDDHLAARRHRRALFFRHRHAHALSSPRAIAAMSAHLTPRTLRAAPANPHAPLKAHHSQLPS